MAVAMFGRLAVRGLIDAYALAVIPRHQAMRSARVAFASR
jgi:hypothetical protein